MSDRILGIACLALAGLYIAFATQIQIGFMSDPLGPKAFPIIIGAALGIAGLYPLLKPDPEPDWPARGRILEIVFAAGVMVAYTYALREAGFVVSTAIAAALLSWRLNASPLAAAIAGVAISVGIYAIFHLVLGLSLARGPWGF
ncbi:MAG TPA: tripartite tricarboxylate transporter TctB family protein [Devosiaceae bacterium]